MNFYQRMKRIIKNSNPPDCLDSQDPNLGWANFIGTACHGQVLNSLIQEQYYLCCYCESDIDEKNSHIEHLFPRNPQPPSRQNPSLQYEYSNLSLSCDGGNIQNQHCGSHKGNRFDQVKFSSPHNSITNRLFLYTLDGFIHPKSCLNACEREKAEYLISLLNLNCPELVFRRRAHARGLRNSLGFPIQKEVIDWFRSNYLQPDENGKLMCFYSLSKTILEP